MGCQLTALLCHKGTNDLPVYVACRFQAEISRSQLHAISFDLQEPPPSSPEPSQPAAAGSAPTAESGNTTHYAKTLRLSSDQLVSSPPPPLFSIARR
jgi:hypothetical protein